MNFDSIVENIQKGMEEKSGYANVMLQCLAREIQEFESQLEVNEEMGIYLTAYPGGGCLRIETIKSRRPYYLVLSGKTDQGQRVSLIQHVAHVGILLTSLKINSEEERPARRFGFTLQDI